MGHKKQKDVNAELAATWEREMQKRNSYFQRFNIPIVTFTDSALADTQSCFRTVAGYLSERSAAKLELKEVLARF